MSQKRIRAINWDEEEKQLFRKIFKEYAQIIENKSLDTNTIKMKNKAWEQFHIRFNQLNSRPRNLIQLKHQWKAMKISARKTNSAFKKETNNTDGGTKLPTPNDTVMLLRDDNIYDSERVMPGKHTCYIKSQNHKDYENNRLNLSKMLKDEEHKRRMEMAEEEHAIKMAIHKEKLKSAILEREILELKCEFINNKQSDQVYSYLLLAYIECSKDTHKLIIILLCTRVTQQ